MTQKKRFTQTALHLSMPLAVILAFVVTTYVCPGARGRHAHEMELMP
jgi:hypothetical protein